MTKLADSPTIHLIALNVPYPANYGGVIDIYYQIVELSQLGVGIILHCWQWDRPPVPLLEEICQEVHYYRRRTGWRSNLSLTPYNVRSRKSERLITRLLEDDFPILYEGLHCTSPLCDKRLATRRHIVRACNVEHDYYYALAQSTQGWIAKAFHYIEAWRWRRYERCLERASQILAVSTSDGASLQHRYPQVPVTVLPCLHAYHEVTSSVGQADYILYHGKLSVAENIDAALWLIKHLFSKMPYRVVIAGMDPPLSLSRAVEEYPHITLLANPSQSEMARLIQEAHIHLLYTHQGTGLKLKLLHCLFAGRHVVANSTMLEGSGLEELCYIGEGAEELRAHCERLMRHPFTQEQIQTRTQLLAPYAANHLGGILYRSIFSTPFSPSESLSRL